VLACIGALVVPMSVLWWGWRHDWLLLLDWAPGPNAAAPMGPVPSLVSWLASGLGNAVGWLPVALALPVAGVGAALASLELRADRAVGWPAVAIATSAAVANPFVVARLYAGQVGVLWAYALLFWLVRSVLRGIERPSPRAGVVVGLLWAACIAATVHAAAIAAVPVSAGVWLHRRRFGTQAALTAGARALGVAVAVTVAWAVPWFFANPPVDPRGSDAAAVFLTRGTGADAWFGAILGGGFWRPLPSGLQGPTVWVAVLLTVMCVCAIGAGRGWARDSRRLLWPTAALGASLALLGHGPTAAAWSWLVEHVSVVAVYREPGKWSMLPVMAAVLLAGLAADRVHRASWPAATVVALTATALSTWAMLAVTSTLRPSQYPAAWEAAAATIDDDCRVAVFGDGAYVDPGFTNGRVVANPALGFFGERALISSDTGVEGLIAARSSSASQRWLDSVNGRYLAGSEGITPQVSAAADVGVGWLFIPRPADEPLAVADVTSAGFTLRFSQPDGGLWQTPLRCSTGQGEQ
jgi:hypothetical protein